MNQPTTAWGIEFSEGGVVLVRVRRRETGYVADRCRIVPLQAAWDRTEGPPWPQAVEALRDLAGEIAPTDEPLAVGLSDERLLFRVLTLPRADPDALARMVEAQAEAVLPGAVELTWGWGRLADSPQSDEQRVLLCAARPDALTRAWTAAARMNPPALAVPSGPALAAAYARFGRDADAEQSAAALVRVAGRHTSVFLLDRGRVAACSTLDRGSEEWAESPDAEPEGGWASWARDVAETYHHAADQLPPPQIPQRCLVIGGADRPEIIHRSLHAALRLPVREAVFSDQLAFAPDVPVEQAAAAAAVALIPLQALPPTITLTPDLPEPQPAPRRSRVPLGPLSRRPVRLAALAVWIAAVVLTLYTLDRREADRLERAVEALRATDEGHGGVERQLRLGRYLEQSATPPLPLLEEIASLTPRRTVLSAWEYHREGRISIRGHVGGVGELEGFLKDLAASPLLENVELRSATHQERERRWDFDIAAEPAPLFRYMALPARPVPGVATVEQQP